MARVLLPSVLALGLLAAHSNAADWNQWRGPNRDGVSPDSPPLLEKLPEQGLQPLWTTAEEIPCGGSGGWSSPVVADGRVYIFAHLRTKKEGVTSAAEKFPQLTEEQEAGLSPDEKSQYEADRRREQLARREREFDWNEVLVAFDLADGKQLWKAERKSTATRFPQSGSPAVIDGRVLLHGARGAVWAVDAKTGEKLWETQLPGEFDGEHHAASIAVANNVAVIFAGHLYGVDAATGRSLWKSEVETSRNSSASPVVWKHDAREYVVAHLDDAETVCIDPRDGRAMWQVKSQAGRSTPIIAGDKLITYGASRKGGVRCFALTPEKAEELWTNTAVADEGSSPVVVQGCVFAHGDRRLACIDLESGKTKWQTELDLARPRYTSLVAGDGKVIFAAEGVALYAASPEGYRPIFEASINKAGQLATTEYFRQLLNLDELEQTAEGQKEAESLWRNQVESHGPQQCISPALAEGKLLLRLKNNRVACYDLRRATAEK